MGGISVNSGAELSMIRPFPATTTIRKIVRGLDEALKAKTGDERALGLVELRAMSLFFRVPGHKTDYGGPFVDPYNHSVDPALYFTGSVLTSVEKCLEAASEHPVRGRLADVLQWRNVNREANRSIAIDEYLKSFEAIGDQIYGTQILLRVAQLSHMSSSVEKCSQAIRAAARKYEEDLHGDLRDVFAAAHLLRKRDPTLLNDLIDTLDRATATLAMRGDFGSLFERELLQLAADAARETKQTERANSFKLRIAQSYERTANFRAPEIAGSALLDAAKAYKEIGDHLKETEFLSRARMSGELSRASMSAFRVELTVPVEQYRRELVREKNADPLD